MKICAGIVTYNPDVIRLKKNIESIVLQVDLVFIVDNFSKNIKDIENITTEYQNVVLVKNSSNEGIATALNQLCLNSKNYGADWILTLDQDTVCESNMIIKMRKYTNDSFLGIICPAVFYEGKENKKKEKELEYPYACMTSGSLTRVSAWEEVGGFCEDYFIDFVDNEFCMKLKLHNYKILRLNEVVMYHQLGEAIEKKIFFVKFRRSVHSSWRYYYMTRNNLRFIKKYKEHLNCTKEYLKLAYILFNGFVFTNDKRQTLKYIIKGLKDVNKV